MTIEAVAAGGPSGGECSPPGPDDIRLQLERITNSPAFPCAGRCSAFLSYVVREAVAGRGKRIKGYSIAIEVFGREEGFTQDDPVVRIEAGKLRRALERYYLVAGQDDPVRIDIPKGCYVPTFTWTAQPSAIADSAALPDRIPSAPGRITLLWRENRQRLAISSAVVLLAAAVSSYWAFDRSSTIPKEIARDTAPEGPSLVVAPFADLGDGSDARLYAVGLTEELLTALPRFKEIAVMGRETSEALPPDVDSKHVSAKLGARYLLTGGVRVSGNEVRVTARLIDTAKGTILWSQDYDDDLRTRTLFSIQTDVAAKVATAVAQPYGIIAQTDIAALPPDDLDAYACTLRFYQYRAELSVERHTAVRDCLESAVARYPSYATAWAMLSMIYLDEHRFKFNQRSGQPAALERSLETARRAVQLDPGNTRGLQALMTALFFNKQPADSLRVGEQALAVNPNDTELMGEYGTRLAMSGEWKRGASILEVALSRNPGGAGYYHGILALADYMQNDDASAVDEIGQANLQKFPLFHVVAAIIYSQRGMTLEAARESAIFNKMGAAFLSDIDADLEARLGRPEDRARILEGIRSAGMNVPEAVAVNSVRPANFGGSPSN
jgi:adenylate cyclase